MNTMEESIEIKGTDVFLVGSGDPHVKKQIPLRNFLDYVCRSDIKAMDIVPRGARAAFQKGEDTVLVIELEPGPRVIYWISDDSKAAYGPEVKDRQVLLSFPYTVMIIKFNRGLVTGFSRLYYRNRPVESMDDQLSESNLLNVSDVPGGQRCWLCLQYFKFKAATTWTQKVKEIVDFFYSWTFTRSSEHHEGNSYFVKNRNLDPRINTVAKWSEATRKDNNFMLSIKWPPVLKSANPPSYLTVRDVIEEMLGAGSSIWRDPKCGYLVNIIRVLSGQTVMPAKPVPEAQPVNEEVFYYSDSE
jgi:hypothetical protein